MSDSYITIPYDIYGRNKALSAYVLNPVREPICQIHGITQFNVTAKFNDVTEIQFEVQRYTTDKSTLEWRECEAYQYLHAFAQIRVPELGKKGYFIIHTEPTITMESTRKEAKTFTAMSYESILEHESLIDFSINCGTEISKEMYEENLDDIGAPKRRIQLYNKKEPKLSLLHWVLKDDYYGWKVGHVDSTLVGLERSFEISNQNVYSFLHADLSKAFRCIVDFDTAERLINIYDIETVGKDTNVYLGIDHFLQQVQISPQNDFIYTVFNVSGDGDLGIELVNFGSQKIVNIDYPLLMVDENLYDKYKQYESVREQLREEYYGIAKIYSDLQNKAAALLDLQPDDEAINKNWSSTIYYTLDDLKVQLKAFQQICDNIKDLYRNEGGSVDYDMLDESADAGLFYTYRDICIPDLKNEIKRRENEDYTYEEVDTNFIFTNLGINDLEAKKKSIENQIEALKKQGYDGNFEDMDNPSKETFEEHKKRYEFLVGKLAELNKILKKKNRQYKAVKADMDSMLERLKEIADMSKLEYYINIHQIHGENGEPMLIEDGLDDIQPERTYSFGYFTDEEVRKIKELYRESDYQDSNYVITEFDDTVSTAVIQRQLLEAANKELEKESRPQYTWTVTSDDLFAMKEFDPLKEQLQLGDFVWLGRNSQAYPQWTVAKQKFRVIELDFSGLKTDVNFGIVFSTMIETKFERNDFEQLLDNAISSSVNSITTGVANRAAASAAKVTNSLIKPYLEVVNAKIDNLEAQNITVEDLRATVALIEHLTVYDLMAGEITADKKLTLVARDGYGSIVLENSQLKFYDDDGALRMLVGKSTGSDEFDVKIWSALNENSGQQLLWSTTQGGLQGAAVANSLISNRMLSTQAVSTEKIMWSGISESVDEDGKPVFSASKIVVDDDDNRLSDQWDALRNELASISISSSGQIFMDDEGVVSPNTIVLTPVLNIINDLSAVHWYYTTQDISGWTEITSTSASAINPYLNTNNQVVVPSGCSLFTATNNSVTFKAAYVVDDVETYTDVYSVYYLTSSSGGGGVGMSYTVVLSNEAQTVATDNQYVPTSAGPYECRVAVFEGTTALSPTSNSNAASNYFYVSATCSEAGATVDYTTTPGLVSVSLNTSTAISPNFEVTLTVTVGGLSAPITKTVSFSASAAALDGLGVSDLVTQYYLSSSNTSCVDGSWSTTPPLYFNGYYYWRRDRITWTDGTITYTTPVLDNGLNSANSTALAAVTRANEAMTSADGKNQIFHRSTAPTGGTYKAGDTWFDTSNGYKMYTYDVNTESWVAEPLDAGAIAAEAIKAEHIDAGAITSDKIAANAITSNKLNVTEITTIGGIAKTADIPTAVSQLTNDASYATTANVANTYATKATAIAEEQIIYKQSVSGTTSMSGTTSWVDRVTESVARDESGLTPYWTTKRPTYRSNYPVLWMAKQSKTVSGTVTCTTPVKDDTLTIIDGGHITTGTIDANRIAANSISANKLILGDQTNLATVNEWDDGTMVVDNSLGTTTRVINAYSGLKSVVKTNASNAYLPLTQLRCSNAFVAGDEFYYELWMRGETIGRNVTIRINAYDRSGTYIGGASSSSIAITTTAAKYTGSITLSDSNITATYEQDGTTHSLTWREAAYYMIGIRDDPNNLDNIRAFRIIVRKKANAELIVDGAITTDKLNANAVTADKIAAGAVTANKIAANAITADKITGNAIDGKNFTGGIYSTKAGKSQLLTVKLTGDQSITNNGASSTDDSYSELSSRRLVSKSASNDAVRAQILPATLTYTGTGSNSTGYGWYVTPTLVVNDNIYVVRNGVSPGPVVTYQELQDTLESFQWTVFDVGGDADLRIDTKVFNDSSPSTGIEGITAYKRNGLVMLYFGGFSFASGSGSSTTMYRLPSGLRPQLICDFLSTNNSVRFRISTDGYIQPMSTVSASTSIRGTFTYLVAANKTTS